MTQSHDFKANRGTSIGGSDAPSIITLSMNKFDGDFTCACGNDSMDSGFYPSTKEGIEIDPIPGNFSTIPQCWEGHFVCAACKQVYLPKED